MQESRKYRDLLGAFWNKVVNSFLLLYHCALFSFNHKMLINVIYMPAFIGGG